MRGWRQNPLGRRRGQDNPNQQRRDQRQESDRGRGTGRGQGRGRGNIEFTQDRAAYNYIPQYQDANQQHLDRVPQTPEVMPPSEQEHLTFLQEISRVHMTLRTVFTQAHEIQKNMFPEKSFNTSLTLAQLNETIMKTEQQHASFQQKYHELEQRGALSPTLAEYREQLQEIKQGVTELRQKSEVISTIHDIISTIRSLPYNTNLYSNDKVYAIAKDGQKIPIQFYYNMPGTTDGILVDSMLLGKLNMQYRSAKKAEGNVNTNCLSYALGEKDINGWITPNFGPKDNDKLRKLVETQGFQEVTRPEKGGLVLYFEHPNDFHIERIERLKGDVSDMRDVITDGKFGMYRLYEGDVRGMYKVYGQPTYYRHPEGEEGRLTVPPIVKEVLDHFTRRYYVRDERLKMLHDMTQENRHFHTEVQEMGLEDAIDSLTNDVKYFHRLLKEVVDTPNQQKALFAEGAALKATMYPQKVYEESHYMLNQKIGDFLTVMYQANDRLNKTLLNIQKVLDANPLLKMSYPTMLADLRSATYSVPDLNKLEKLRDELYLIHAFNAGVKQNPHAYVARPEVYYTTDKGNPISCYLHIADQNTPQRSNTSYTNSTGEVKLETDIAGNMFFGKGCFRNGPILDYSALDTIIADNGYNWISTPASGDIAINKGMGIISVVTGRSESQISIATNDTRAVYSCSVSDRNGWEFYSTTRKEGHILREGSFTSTYQHFFS